MNYSFPSIDIIEIDDFNKFYSDFDGEISNLVELDNKVMVIYKSLQQDEKTMLYGDKETHNVSIAIASAITAYARIHMTQFKNNPKFNLYYTDTDSIYIDKPLPEDLVNSKVLGLMKLENVLTKAIFLAPKTYCLLTEKDELIHKVKGLSHDIELTMDDYNNLLSKDSILQKSQTKWNKNLSKGHISVLDQLYTLKVTENKRRLIYDENNKLTGTVPYVINKDKEIIN
uniref:Uncharacterized protein n=1 Tax=Lactarius sp. (in: basidiomycete fungi) TaxID=1886493 RepID=A0A2S0U433_9AGAM|nr:hypothetical protein [Lactarius sp. (in: basidiomycete fungi)]